MWSQARSRSSMKPSAADPACIPGCDAHSLAQTFEIAFVRRSAQMLPVLIQSDQFAHILAAGAVAAFADLFIHLGLQCLWH